MRGFVRRFFTVLGAWVCLSVVALSADFRVDVGVVQDFCVLGDRAYLFGKKRNDSSPTLHLCRYNLQSGELTRVLSDDQEKLLMRDRFAQLAVCPRTQQLAAITAGSSLTARSQRNFTEIVLVDLQTGRGRRIVSNGRYNIYPEFSPDGSEIAFYDASADVLMHQWEADCKGFSLSVVDLATDAVRRIAEEDWRPTRESPPAWSPDGKRIAFTATYDRKAFGQLYVIDRTGGRPRRITPPDAKACEHPLWTPDNTILYSASRGREYGLYSSVADGRPAMRLVFPCSVRSPLDLSPDGKTVVFMGAPADGDLSKSEPIVLDPSGRRLTDQEPNLVLHRWRR